MIEVERKKVRKVKIIKIVKKRKIARKLIITRYFKIN